MVMVYMSMSRTSGIIMIMVMLIVMRMVVLMLWLCYGNGVHVDVSDQWDYNDNFGGGVCHDGSEDDVMTQSHINLCCITYRVIRTVLYPIAL